MGDELMSTPDFFDCPQDNGQERCDAVRRDSVPSSAPFYTARVGIAEYNHVLKQFAAAKVRWPGERDEDILMVLLIEEMRANAKR